MEKENKRLRVALKDNKSDYENRINEMLTELDRLSQLSLSFQNHQCSCQKVEKKKSSKSKKPRSQNMSAAELTLASIFPGLCDNMDVQLPNLPQSPDDICAALSSFVEKNKQNTIDENSLAALLSVPNCEFLLKLTLFFNCYV